MDSSERPSGIITFEMKHQYRGYVLSFHFFGYLLTFTVLEKSVSSRMVRNALPLVHI